MRYGVSATRSLKSNFCNDLFAMTLWLPTWIFHTHLYSQKTPHILLSWVSYGVSIVSILQKIDGIAPKSEKPYFCTECLITPRDIPDFVSFPGWWQPHVCHPASPPAPTRQTAPCCCCTGGNWIALITSLNKQTAHDGWLGYMDKPPSVCWRFFSRKIWKQIFFVALKTLLQ